MDADVRRVVASLALAACRRLTVLAWPTLVLTDLALALARADSTVPLAVYAIALALTCVTLTDWLRRALLAAQAAADADRDRILARVYDRIDEESTRAREDLERSVAWLLRRMDRGG